MLLNFVKLGGLQLLGRKLTEWEFSWIEIFRVGIFQVGVILGGDFPSGNRPGVSYPGREFSVVGVFMLSLICTKILSEQH